MDRWAHSHCCLSLAPWIHCTFFYHSIVIAWHTQKNCVGILEWWREGGCGEMKWVGQQVDHGCFGVPGTMPSPCKVKTESVCMHLWYTECELHLWGSCLCLSQSNFALNSCKLLGWIISLPRTFQRSVHPCEKLCLIFFKHLVFFSFFPCSLFHFYPLQTDLFYQFCLLPSFSWIL